MTSPEFPSPQEFNQLINFHFEDIEIDFPQINFIINWINQTIESEKNQLDQLNFIFCSDSYLHKINLEYLKHDTFTDVITFPYSEESVEGDIFISIERIRENAKNLNQSFENELHRVIIHGVLHLMHYGDKNPEEIELMRSKENYYLNILNGMILDS